MFRGKSLDDWTVEDILNNVASARTAMWQSFLDPRRDIDDECGYPAWKNGITFDTYQELYDREPIANRAVEVLPKETWQVQPSVFEDENPDKVTPFEEAWDGLGKMLRGEESFYEEEQGSQVWEYLLRADIQSGIGQFGLILIGLDDGKPLSEPADKYESEEGSARKLLFLRVFPESQIQITAREYDPTSPRFGLPTQYLVTFEDDTNSRATPHATQAAASEQVHWTRVVHFADNLGSSEVLGIPRMRPILNRLLDCRKLYGGSAEMYWRGAFPGLSLETHPQMGGQVNIDKSKMKETMEQYMNGLQRYLLLFGMSAKTLAPQVVDPTAQINAQIEAICIQLGIPKRIFMGSERGELASSQDDAAWNDRLKFRQDHYCTPRIIVPFVDKLIWLGVLPKPKKYLVVWPDLTSKNEGEKTNIIVGLTDAMKKYVEAGLDALITPMDWLTKIMGFDEDTATQVLDNTAKAIEEEEKKAAEDLALGGDPFAEEGEEGDLLGGGTEGDVELDEDGNPIEAPEGEGDLLGEGEEGLEGEGSEEGADFPGEGEEEPEGGPPKPGEGENGKRKVTGVAPDERDGEGTSEDGEGDTEEEEEEDDEEEDLL